MAQLTDMLQVGEKGIRELIERQKDILGEITEKIAHKE